MAATLTDIAIRSRQAIRYGIFLVILYFIGRAAFGGVIKLYQAVNPPKTPAPQARFGPLPALPFPQRQTPQLTYTLETPTGGLPTLPNQANVYFIPRSSVLLLSSEAARKKAVALGYTTEPEEVSQTVYRFRHPTTSSTLEIDIVSNSFSISYNLGADPNPITSLPPTIQEATTTVRSILSRAGVLPSDLTGEVSHEFLRIDSQGLSTVSSLSEANLIKISLHRADIEEIPSKTVDPDTGNVWFILSSDKDRQVVLGQYRYFSVDQEQASSYPLKDPSTAFEELKTGKGFVASLSQSQQNQVTIRRVYLAYFDPDTYTDFYQPIYVFEGDNNFVGYVPAVSSQYYGQKQTEPSPSQ